MTNMPPNFFKCFDLQGHELILDLSRVVAIHRGHEERVSKLHNPNTTIFHFGNGTITADVSFDEVVKHFVR